MCTTTHPPCFRWLRIDSSRMKLAPPRHSTPPVLLIYIYVSLSLIYLIHFFNYCPPMSQVVARRLEPSEACSTWALYSEREPTSPPPTLAVLGRHPADGATAGARYMYMYVCMHLSLYPSF